MGLSVSQIRLLALTNRKADIEHTMTVDSKRKQQLTRKSTELSQEYYNRLQNSTIQYATSNGYEDVNFSYLMGETKGNNYTSEFLQQVVSGDSSVYNVNQKVESSMILTNQFGEVVVNDQIAKLVAKTSDAYSTSDIKTKTAQAIAQFIIDTVQDPKGTTPKGFATLYAQLCTGDTVNTAKKNQLVKYIQTMLKNDGYKNGGIIYEKNGEYFRSADGDPNSWVNPENGYCYRVGNVGSGDAVYNSIFFWSENGENPQPMDESTTLPMTDGIAEALGNLVDYFGPMLSAAFANDISTEVTRSAKDGATLYNCVNGLGLVQDGSESNTAAFDSLYNSIVGKDAATIQSELQTYFNTASNWPSGSTNTLSFAVVDGDGVQHFFNVTKRTNTGGGFIGCQAEKIKEDEVGTKFYNYTVEPENHKNFVNAMSIENLQAGFKSGTYQLAMVTESAKGTYHKNTKMNYFVHMNYVADKTDSSKREEITAWFNTEQAKISEKETYWDAEIQNLSTELNAVNEEINAVKQLKSNAIKSVFNWGAQ